MKTKFILVFFCAIALANIAGAQVAGDFRSIASASWNVSTTWERYSGTVWEASGVGANNPGQTPGATNAVFIQSGHTVTLTQNESCNDLHIANSTTSALGTRGIIAISSFTLSVNGKMRAYWGPVGTVPGTSSSLGYSAYPFTVTSGKVSLTGNSRTVLATGEWSATVNTTSNNFPLEVNLNAGQTVTFVPNVKASSINVVSGTLDCSSVSADNGTTGSGDITIASGATLISNASSTAVFQRTGTTVAGTLTVNGTLRLTGAAPVMRMTAINFNGTVEYIKPSAAQSLAVAGSGGANPVVYNNLTIDGNSGITKTTVPALATTVNGKFSMIGSGSVAFTIGAGGSFVYGPSATLEYQVTSARTVGVEWPVTSGPFNVTIASGSSGVLFTDLSSTARTIPGLFTMSGGNFTVNSTNSLTFGNGATIIRNAGSLLASGGTINHGLLSTDLVNITINFDCTSSSEISGTVTPGKIGILTIASGISYTNGASRTVTSLVNNGILVLSPNTTMSLNVSGNISGTGTITSNLSTGNSPNYYSASLNFTGSTALGTLLMTPGFNTIRNFTLNNNAGIILGNALKVDTTLTLTSGTLTTGGNLTLGDGTSIVRTAGTLSAAPVFGTSVNLNYNNTTATTTGPEFPASSSVLNNLTVNNAGGVLLSGNATVNGTLTLTTGALSLASNSLTINGAVSGAGAITSTASSNVTIGGTAGTLNFTTGSALNNLTLNNASSATLGTALDVYGTIALTSASLNLNAKNLTLKSNASGTARIADLTGSTLTGATNVTVERYIKLRAGGDGRAYRLLTPTVNTTGTIQANWMETGMNTAIGTNVDPVPGYGTQISGSGGNANGFDKTASNAASLYTVTNAVTPTYTAVGAVNSGTMNAKTGYFLYLRGDRNQDMTLPLASNMPTSATTLRTTGTVLTGTQTSFTNAFTGGGAWNLVTNPYPSPIDWSLVQSACTGVTGSYIYWDPNIGTRGGFAAVTTAGVSTPSTSATQIIQPGQAFFVESDGAVPTVSIQETHKVAGNNNDVFFAPPPPVEAFRTELYFTEANGYRRVADGVVALYNDNYSAVVDSKDTKEINNWDENIAISREGKHLAIESRPVIGKSDDLPIFMNNMKKQTYEFEFTPAAFTNTNLKAELVDNFLGTRSLLSVTQPTVVRFSITNDPASAATDRFKVVFGAFGNPQGVDAITIKAAQQGSAVQVDWTSKTETDMVQYEVEKQTYGTAFVKVNSTAAKGNSAVAVNYNWLDTDPTMGTSFYRIKGTDKAGNVRYSEAVRVLFGKGEPAIVAYPNPVQGNSFKIDMYNLPAGSYLLSLYNNMGQLVHSQQLQHDGSQATRMISLPADMGKGAYQLQLDGGKGFKTTQRIIKN